MSVRWPLPELVLAGLLTVAMVAVPVSEAGFAAPTTNGSSSFAADTLTPPTSVSGVTSTSQVTLSWTPTADAYASGYHVYRSLSPSSGYTLVATVPDRSSTSVVDPYTVTQTTYYRMRASYLAWASADSNTVTVQPGYAQTVLGTSGLVSYWRGQNTKS